MRRLQVFKNKTMKKTWPLFWRKCQKCGFEFRWEYGWVEKSKPALKFNRHVKYFCNRCITYKNEIKNTNKFI